MKNTIYLFFLLILPQFLFSQSSPMTGSLKGQLVDDQQQAVAYATISLLNAQEELVVGAISNEEGNFSFDKLPLETLTLKVQFLGFQELRQSIALSRKNKKVKLGAVQLAPDLQQLEEVTVTAEKSQYNIRLDKKVFHVGKDVLAQGGSAIDILDQVPLVSVEPTGAVALRGSNQVQILINGKRSGLTMNNALDQIPSDNIDRVEVITNPSAGFDASGSAGIINIILKKNKIQGWNGQLRAVVGAPANHVVMPGINYKGKKINIFSNFRWRYADYNGIYKTEQSTTNNGITSFLNKDEEESRHDDGRSAYIGGDYTLNDQNSFTLAYFRAETKDTDETFLDYELSEEAQTSRHILRQGNSVENRNYNQLEANYTKTFATKGQKFTTDIQYDFWNSTKDWSLSTSGDEVPPSIGNQLRTNSVSGSKDFVLQSDYVHPWKDKGIFEVGLKVENRIVNNDYSAESFADGIWKTFQNIDNKVDYSEKIGAAYLQYKGKFKQVEFMLGVRSEYTLLDVKDEESTFTNQQDYVNLFPSVHLSYALNDSHTFQWSYSRRINRPSLWNIYPFYEIRDFNSQFVGNPNLTPSFSDVLELSFLSVGEKLTINPAIYYRHTVDPFANFLFQNEQETFIIKPINIDQKETVGLELSLRYQPFKALSLNSEVNFFHFNETGTYEGQNLDAKGTTWSARINANVNLPKNIKLQAKFDYWAPEQRAQIKELSSYALTFALSKNFLADKLNISLRGFNILDTRINRSISESATYRIENSSRRYGARWSVAMVYKFNQTSRDRMRQQQRGNR